MRELLKTMMRAAALALVSPAIVTYRLKALAIGKDRALEGSSQALAWLPGLPGVYLRRAFLAHAIDQCHATAVVEFGTILSQAGARIGAAAYVGPRCHLGLVHIGDGALLAAGVHVPSGGRTHGYGDLDLPIHAQPGERQMVRIGDGAWIGSAAVVLADVGRGTVVGAGAVVTRPLPDEVVAAGVPARVLRHRRHAEAS